jgi:hypothetical protein
MNRRFGTSQGIVANTEAGFYQSPWGTHARLQILTVPELLGGKRIDAPPMGQVGLTFKKAPTVEPHPELPL